MPTDQGQDGARELLRQALIAFRKGHGYASRTELARRLEVGESTLRDWESGRSSPKPAQLLRLKAIGVEVPAELLPTPDETERTAATARRLQAGGELFLQNPGVAGPPDRAGDVGRLSPDGPRPAVSQPARAPRRTAEQVLEVLRRESSLGRVPLLIIGSGMSKGQVPLQPDITALLNWHLNRVDRAEPSIAQILELSTGLCEKLRDSTKEQLVTSIELAQLFTAAAGATTKGLREAWYAFSDDLLRGGNEELKDNGRLLVPKGIYGAEPTTAHLALAKLLVERKCLCVSINFDHLAWLALRTQGTPCVVLHDSDQITQYFTALSDIDVPAVIHLRGDVLNVRCVEPSCPQSMISQVLSALIQRERAQPATPESATPAGPLRCDACGAGRLAAEMSFPGEAAKERMGRDALDALQTYVAGRLSALVFVGVSGRWDPHILRWAAEYSREFHVPIVHVKQSPRPSHIQQFLQVYYPSESACDVVVQDKDAFLADLTATLALKPTMSPSVSTPLDGYSAADLCDKDEIWYRDSVFKPDGRASVSFADFSSVYVPKSVGEYLNSFTQLSLVNSYLGLTKGHTRWDHSRGTAAVGSLWMKRLHEELVRSGNLDRRSEDRLGLLVKHALLMHDCGHIPFSHLIERVLSRIHWVSGGVDTIEADTLSDRLTKRAFGIGVPTGEVGLLEMAEHVSRILEVPDAPGVTTDEASRMLLDLVRGMSPFPFLNVICNSPIDADKIDYITRDSFELTRSASGMRAAGALGARVEGGRASYDWISDFLSDQEVTRHGAIALHGRSAVAAAELWRQRVWTYQRVYFSPEIRVLERGIAEILEQFAIRYVVGGHSEWTDGRVPVDPRTKGDAQADLRKWKADAARRVLEYLAKVNRQTNREQYILEHIFKCLTDPAFGRVIYDPAYVELLQAVWGMVRRWLPPEKPSWPSGTLEHLVGHPLYAKVREDDLVDRLRPLQHQFGHTVLIDVVRGAKALSGPPSLRSKSGEAVFGNILVPTGHCRTWTGKSRATRVLTSKAVADVEDTRCQVLVISPRVPAPPAALHAYQAVREVVDQFEAAQGGEA